MNTPRTTSPSALLAPALLAVALTACTIGPDHRPPAFTTPAAYRSDTNAIPDGAAGRASTPGQAAGVAPLVPLATWWETFADARMTALMRTAMASNLEVRIAQARVREARAQRGATGAQLWPQVDASAGYSRARLSGQGLNGRQLEAFGQPLENDQFDAALDMSWELDVFGGTRRATEAARADLDASIEARRGTLVGVLAEVGLAYLDFRGATRQIEVARAQLKAQEQTLALTQDRLRAGLGQELDVARATAQVAATRASIPPLEEARERARHRLGVLLGQPPGSRHPALAALDEPAPSPVATPRVPVGLPADLLRQRPDLREAERRLAAATARVGAARADWFPRFFLTGAAGLQSVEAADFLTAGSRFWSLGPSLQWPIFSAGRIRQQVRVQDARQEQALLQCEQTLLVALEETENALLAFGREQARHEAIVESTAAQRRAVALATDRHRSGLTAFLDVLEAERSLLATEDALVQSDRRLGQHLVRLYKALGGGWTAEAAASASRTPAPDSASASSEVRRVADATRTE